MSARGKPVLLLVLAAAALLPIAEIGGFPAPVFPASALAEGLGHPVFLGGSESRLPAHFDQALPAAAVQTADPRTALIVWQDERAGDADIFAARVDSAGVLIDLAGFPLAIGSPQQTDPAVAYGGGRFLVVWCVSDGARWDLQAVRVDPSGVVLDAIALTLASGARELASPAVGFDGTQFVVLWSDRRAGDAAIFAARVPPSGSLSPDPGVRIAGGQRDLGNPDWAYGGEKNLAVWEDAYVTVDDDGDSTQVVDIRGILLAPDLSTLGDELTIAGTNSEELEPAVAGDDSSRFLVAWVHRRDAGRQFLFARTVTGDGEVQSDSLEISRLVSGLEAGFRRSPQVTLDEEGFLVSWTQVQGDEGIRAARVTFADRIPQVAAAFRVSAVEAGEVSCAWDGAYHLFAHSFAGEQGSDVGLTRLKAGEEAGDAARTIAFSTPSQIPCAVATDGTDFLVVWEEQTAAGWITRAGRVSGEGDLLDPAGLTLIADAAADRLCPALAAGAGGYVLAWADEVQRVLHARFLDADGRPVGDELAIAGTQAIGTPAIAWDGSRFLVAWTSADPSGVFATRLEVVGGSLTALDLPPPSIARGAGILDPAVCFGSGGYLVVWSEVQDNMLAAWLDPETLAASSATLAPAFSPSATSLTFDGSFFHLVWEDHGGDVYTMRVLPGGTPYDAAALPVARDTGTSMERPTVIFDGHTRLALWSEPADGVRRISGARLAPNGAPQAPGVFAVADEVSAQRWPIAAPGVAPEGGSVALIAYGALVLDAELSSLRVAARLWVQDPPELTLAIHQNPAVTSDIAVYILPSEDLDDERLTLHANGEPVELTVTDEERGIQRGWYRALATEVVTVRAQGLDLAGNLGAASRSFTVAIPTFEEGGEFLCPFGVVALSCPPGAMEPAATLLILPDEGAPDGGATACASREWAWGFQLSPAGLALARPVDLAIRLPATCRPPDGGAGAAAGSAAPTARASDPGEWTLVLERETTGGWELVPARCCGEGGTVAAAVTQLGHFRVRWVRAAEAAVPRLALSPALDPDTGGLVLRFGLPHGGRAELSVFDLSGRRLRTLLDRSVDAGWHLSAWDGRDARGCRAASGVYFARLSLDGQSMARQCLLVR